jgi:hypothetical protein
MNIENISINEKLTLKPLPKPIFYCTVCKITFTSYLRLNAEFYKTCDNCRHKIRVQDRKQRKDYKQLISDFKKKN